MVHISRHVSLTTVGLPKPAARFERLDSGAAGALRQVKLDLVLQVAIQPAAPEQRAQSRIAAAIDPFV